MKRAAIVVAAATALGLMSGAIYAQTSPQGPQEIELFGGAAEPDKPAAAPSSSKEAKGPKLEVTTSSGIEIAGSGASVDDGNVGSVDGSATIKFKRQGLSMFVEAKLQGKRVYFIVDTGASYTALSPEVARMVGVMPPQGAPTTTINTANGQTQAAFGVVPSFEFGGRRHANVTYLLCPSCGASKTPWGAPLAGLLGMNVLRRYTMKIDDARGLLELQPSIAYHDREPDIRPWLKAERPTLKRKTRQGPRYFGVKLHNAAPQRIDELRLVVECQGEGGARSEERAAPSAVDAGRARGLELALSERCQPVDWRLEGLRW